MAGTSRLVRTWLEPQRPPTPRAAGTIVAKDTTPTVQSLLVIGETLVATHHEGLSSSVDFGADQKVQITTVDDPAAKKRTRTITRR